MNVTIVSWNMAGAKVFDNLDGRLGPAVDTYTRPTHLPILLTLLNC